MQLHTIYVNFSKVIFLPYLISGHVQVLLIITTIENNFFLEDGNSAKIIEASKTYDLIRNINSTQT